jgi:8-oxo-dGTP pyrophosphatase MutT (NUDIX family)
MARAKRVEPQDRTEGSGARVPLARLPAAAVEALVRATLDPIERFDPAAAAASDHDLNPEISVPIDGLQPAAVLVALIERPEGLTVLFTQRADQLRRHAGQIAFPGGQCEAGETPWQTALREAHEEVGLDPALARVAGLDKPYRTITGYHIVPVVAFVSPPDRFVANVGEVADVFEAPFAWLMDPAHYEQRHREGPPGPPRWYWSIAWQDRVIWGATAGMVRGLYERLEAAHASAS